MIQPTRVLPSNAPPLLDAQSAHHGSRVLQEHSGNRQPNDYSYLNHAGQKYPAELLTENAYVGHPPQHVPHVYRPTLQQRHAWRLASSRHQYSHENQERNDKLARYLYHRFRASDQYMKYRTRQSKEDKGSQEQKWPDRLELAFFQALIRWPPMGRRKLLHKEKQRGRNELIADYIEELTGEARTRKQVSSHIQVLKPFVEHDPFIMKWLSKEDFGQGNTASRYAGPYGSSYASGRRMSNYPVTAVPNTIRSTAGVSPMPQAPSSGLNGLDLSHVKQSISVFEPVDFSMFVQRKHADDSVERLHTYTQSIKHPLQDDEHVADWATLAQEFPHLSSMHTHRPLDCNVVVAEASLAFPTETWKDKEGVELGISFLCSSRHLPPTAQVACQNSFYRNGQFLREYSSASEVHFSSAQDGQTVETQVKFGSTFWAKTLAHLAGRMKESTSPVAATNGVVEPARDPREEVAAHIRGLNATQEVLVLTEQGQERVLVIFWKFRLSSSSCGRASWQRIVLPCATPTTTTSTAVVGLSDYNASVDPKQKRQDSVYEYGVQYPTLQSSQASQLQQQQQHHAQQSQPPSAPMLQSPFEYDASSAGTSALTSATSWPNSIPDDTSGLGTAPQSAIDFNSAGADNAFDFSGGTISLSYDSNMVDFNHFDSSAFNFDPAVADFAEDPALQEYSAAAAAAWCDPASYSSVSTAAGMGYEPTANAMQQHHQHHHPHPSQQAVQVTQAGAMNVCSEASYAPHVLASCDVSQQQQQLQQHHQQHQHFVDGYGNGGHGVMGSGGYEQSLVSSAVQPPQVQGYHAGMLSSHDGGQAYGGAGQGEGAAKMEEDAANSLAVLADASYLASSNLVGQ